MNDGMRTSTTYAARVLLFAGLFSTSLAEQPTPTISPNSEFIARPRNVTVLEGYPTVLRCKMRETVHNCQWFYLKEGLNMFNSSAEPFLVKEFRPIRESDCSIKFNKTSMVQMGQWICKGLQIHARKYIVSKPAFLRVIPNKDELDLESRSDPDERRGKDQDELATGLSFHLTEEGHIINTNLGDTAVIGCKVNKEIKTCSWIRPDGTTLRAEERPNKLYAFEGNFTEGNCSLVIRAVSGRDEGNWRCVVSAADQSGDKLGPLIHLHVLEFGMHVEDDQNFLREKTNGLSLIGILVATSVALLVVIVALVCYMYRRIWRSNSSPHKHLEASRSAHSDYSSYGTTWLPEIGDTRCPKLIDDGTEMGPPSKSNSNQYTRYLDMTGNGKGEGYVMFPAVSLRSSMSSRTTLCTVPVEHNAILDSDRSVRTSTNLSLHSSSSFGAEDSHSKVTASRSDSLCSDGHVYEEIDETRMRRKNGNLDLPDYANIDEDHDGYMIPKSHSLGALSKPETPAGTTPLSMSKSLEKSEEPTQAPPYSKVGEGGLIPDLHAPTFVPNPTYSAAEEERTPEAESFNAPNDPPIPIRTDSADNPLAAYDVPKRSGENSSPVFV